MRFPEFAPSHRFTRAITTLRGRTAHWTRMDRSRARFSRSDASCHMPWSVDFITNTSESELLAHTHLTRTRPMTVRRDPAGSGCRAKRRRERSIGRRAISGRATNRGHHSYATRFAPCWARSVCASAPLVARQIVATIPTRRCLHLLVRWGGGASRVGTAGVGTLVFDASVGLRGAAGDAGAGGTVRRAEARRSSQLRWLRAGSAACARRPRCTSHRYNSMGLLRTPSCCLPADENSHQSWWLPAGQPLVRLHRRFVLSSPCAVINAPSVSGSWPTFAANAPTITKKARQARATSPCGEPS